MEGAAITAWIGKAISVAPPRIAFDHRAGGRNSRRGRIYANHIENRRSDSGGAGEAKILRLRTIGSACQFRGI